jgi:thiol-disulfide isomerase/thioredoxin
MMKDDSDSSSKRIYINELKDRRIPFILYFETPYCGVCHVVFPKLMKVLNDYEIEVIKIDAVENPEIAGQHLVFTVPTILVWAEGKEMLRESRYIDFSKITRMLDALSGASE